MLDLDTALPARVPPRVTPPLLRGRLREDARGALADLSARFLRFRSLDARGETNDPRDLAVLSGLGGLPLVHMGLESAAPGAGHAELAGHAVEAAVARLGGAPLGVGLSGLAGLGWMLGHLVEASDGTGDDPCAPFDAALESALAVARWGGPYDLDGLAGIGIYALGRLARASGRRLLAQVVHHLDASARRKAPGLAWSRIAPAGAGEEWNLGVAHGVPGILGFLGLVAASAEAGARTRARARAMLRGAVPWLLAQELPADRAGGFPAVVPARGASAQPARLAWCYGDAGIAATLLLAARGANEPGWEVAARRIGLRAAARSDASAGVVDANLCHGAAGVAHIFHRLYRATADRRFADAARHWFGRTLAMRVPGRGFAGFRDYDGSEGGRTRWVTDPGLLGAGGVALTLVAAVTGAEPAWDRLLLLS